VLAFSVHAEDEKVVVVGSAKELKGITAKKVIWKKDGAVMMAIPASGTIDIDLYIEPFWMDATEVTVGQFKKFLKSSGYKGEDPDNPIDWEQVSYYSPSDKHPMTQVSWHDATAYAKWSGKRLPTEEEWEYATRGGLIHKEYPWGDEISHDEANYAGTGGKDQWEHTAPVGSFAANGYGLFDMAGTFGNGVRIGIIATKTAGCCRAGLGSTVLPTCAWLSATASLRITGPTTASGFAVLCQNRQIVYRYYFSPDWGGARAFTNGALAHSQNWRII